MSDEENSVAPIERVNITYKSKAHDNQDVELPFKLMVMGEFSFKEDPTLLGDRPLIEINKESFDRVMQGMQIGVDVDVADVMSGGPDARIQTRLEIGTLKDMTPDRIVEKIPQMKRQLDLSNALLEVKADLANPKKRAALQEKILAVLNDEDARKTLEERRKLEEPKNTGGRG